MKKLQVAKLSAAIITASILASMPMAQAAIVTIDTPALAGQTSYQFGSQNYDVQSNDINDQAIDTPPYITLRTEKGLVAVEENNGEELIFLGAHETSNHNSSGGIDNDVTVTVNNLNPVGEGGGAAALTEGVSLVLSAAESLVWNIAIDDNVQVNNIFLFGLKSQEITINGQAISLGSSPVMFGDINVEVSPIGVCGYALPTDGQGCNTDRILGINQQSFDFLGLESNTNEFGLNYLADLTDLAVTNFNGSYLADGFNVGINSTATVVPLPGALVFFVSALGVLANRKRLS